MAAPRRHRITGCLLICTPVLALTEYAVITIAVKPMPSTQIDWLVATLVIAPLAAAFLLWIPAVSVRIVADATKFLCFLGRQLTRGRK